MKRRVKLEGPPPNLPYILVFFQKISDLLKQQFALSTAGARLTQEAGDGNAAAERFTIENISNPAKVARILAESFYQELKKAGFSQGHIATAAAQILDCITKEP